MPTPDTSSQVINPALSLLLLCNEMAWQEAAEHFVKQHDGAQLSIAATPQAAVQHLVQPGRSYSHVLIQPEASGEQLDDLLLLSEHDPDSGTRAIILGEVCFGDPLITSVGSPSSLSAVLGVPARASKILPVLVEAEISAAFAKGCIECRFQPIVSITDRRLTGIETLVRLNHPQLGTIAPDLFIPQIERSGLSLPFTEAVAATALTAAIASFLDRHDVFLTVNIPLDVLLLPDAVERIDRHRLRAGIRSDRILIELTESHPVIDVSELATALQRWRDAGYRAAIDDIGPSTVNESQLLGLPFSTVKLDKQAVGGFHSDSATRDYLRNTVGVARLHGMSVIAEGVESETQWQTMLDLGVDQAQGFLISRALPAPALPLWLESWTAQMTP